jgi:molybdate transport system substrate-binding protein
MPLRRFTFIILYISLYAGTAASYADTLRVAVASNFNHTLKVLAADFQRITPHTLKISSASTGKLYAQIMHGAPFDIFLSADEARADLLIHKGKASAELSRVYALGKLVLLSNIQPAAQCRDILTPDNIKYLAIANPKIAPYGAASRQVLQAINQWTALKSKLVLGENIAQTLQFVSTGNATAGLVALSMLRHSKNINYACQWEIPDNMYAAIKQKMIVLRKAENKPAARAFWQYMQSERALNIIRKSGYDIL